MSDTMIVVCPECRKQLRVPVSLQGKKVRCKTEGCGAIIAVEANSAAQTTPSARPVKPASPGAIPAAKPTSTAKPTPTAKPSKPAAAESIPAAKPVPAAKPKSAADDDDDDVVYSVKAQDLAPRCPFCAKELDPPEAVICIHCGYNTITRQRATTKKVYETTGQDVFMWILPGILGVIGIILLIVMDVLAYQRIPPWMEANEWDKLVTPGVCVFWVVFPSLFMMYRAGKVAVYRLILHPKPPEREKKS